jgi:acyl-CoA dehydrogenase
MRSAGWVLRALLLPPGMRATPPSDKATALCANILLEPSDTRDRLVGAVWEGHDSPSVEQLEHAFGLVVEVQPLLDRIRHAGLKDWRVAYANGAITPAQADTLEAAEKAVAAVIEVDDFAPGAFKRPQQA